MTMRPRSSDFLRHLAAATPLILAAMGCSPYQTDGEFMFLRNDGADMPIWVRGNLGSDVFVVWLSSGPGDPIEVMRGPGTDGLEEHYGMVYWDQRGCGSAQGNPRPETFTMDQFVEDTDGVIEIIRHRYDPEHIFLIGHSWGGTLGTAYLLDPKRQAKISGFIDLAGNHDFSRVFPMKIDWLEAYAEDEIAAGRRVTHWTKVVDWTRTEPPITVHNFHKWGDLVEDTNADWVDPDNEFSPGFDVIFESGSSAFAYLFVNKEFVIDSLYHSDEAIQSFSYSEQMHAITLPVAMLWGRQDGIVPLPAAEAALAAIGTAPADQRLVLFEDSGHFSFVEEPDAFVDAVTDFVDAYR